MRKLLVLGSTLVFLAGGALAQQHQNPPAANAPQNEAVKSPNAQQTSRPVAGANSFTEGQAKSHIQEKGYMNVSDLKKDDSGVWRGKAMKDGKQVDVSLDYQGNVAAK